MTEKNLMRLVFFCDTSSWTTGKALAISNGVHYDEEASDHQVIEAERIEADLDELNEIIRGIPIVGGNSEDYILGEEEFAKLKDYLKERGRVVHEDETRIVVENRGGKNTKTPDQELRSWWEILVDVEDTLNETLGMFNRENPVADKIEKAIGGVSRVRKKVDKTLEVSGKMYCEACDAHFWIDPSIELATSDYVCPYCGEGKDVVPSKA